MKHTRLLIIGAGPFGLALAAYAKQRGIEHVVAGRPMEFWKSNMPAAMYLRSVCDWHLDPWNEATIERYLETKNQAPSDVEPLSLNFYLGYCEWFQQQKAIETEPWFVQQLDYTGGSAPFYTATIENGSAITATNVVLALGFRYFKHIPEPYPALFPPERSAHTCDLVDFRPLQGKRVLIIGGRQSAFEWAALLKEQGAQAVYLSYRHPTPAFLPADWSWVNPLVEAMITDPGWFRRLSAEEKQQVNRRLWAEGRLKLEPWLAARIHDPSITLLPESHVRGCEELPDGALMVQLDTTDCVVDQVIFATGYKVDTSRIPLLANGNLLPLLATRNGFPVLDEHFQSNLPGLFFTSLCATQDFGPFFGFTGAVRTSAHLIGAALE